VKFSVDLCLFTYRAISANASQAINQMVKWSEDHGIEVKRWEYGNALIHRSRNEALARTRPDATHVLFVDDDMAPEPSALHRLLNIGHPVVSALCTTRQYRNVRIAAKVYDAEKDVFGQLEKVNLGYAITGALAPGTAFLLIERATVDRIIEYHLSGRDWLAEHQKQLNRLRVRSEARESERARLEAQRRKLWADEKLIRVFDYPVSDDGHQLGEDICFARKCLNLGIEVTLDSTTLVYHLGEHPYSVRDILAEE
jgi:hypothetical protein